MRLTPFVLTLALLLPVATAQGPQGFPTTPIEELAITPGQADVVEMLPGAEATFSYTLGNQGEATLNLVFLAGGRGGFNAPEGAGGSGGFNGSRPPRGEGSMPPPGAAPAPGGFNGMPPGGSTPRGVNASFVGDPNVTITPGESVVVTYLVRVSAGAQPGDIPVMVFARERDANRTATHTTMVRVSALTETPDPSEGPTTPDAPDPAEGEVGIAETPSRGGIATLLALCAAALVLAGRRKR